MFKKVSTFSDEVAAAIAGDGTKWSFIPIRSPHHGGLWEAAVKSFKFHLKRVADEATLTHEEWQTLSCQIEAILNSRLLCPISNDPESLVALTPAHFLIGAPLTLIPETYEPSAKFNPEKSQTSRWRLLKEMRDSFWMRW